MSPQASNDELPWITDDPHDTMENDMEYEDIADEFIDIEAETALDFEVESKPKSFTARQRIEMVREQQWLKSMMEDFGDFDEFSSFDNGAGDYVGGVPH